MKRTAQISKQAAKRRQTLRAKDTQRRQAVKPDEMKYFDTELQSTAIAVVTTTYPAGAMKDPGTTIDLGGAAVATPLTLFAPVVGAALNQRIGRNCNVYKIKVRGAIQVATQAAQAAADNVARVRLMLVQDTQTNIAQMTAAQLLRNAGGASTTISSYQNPDNFGKFRVLKDKMITINNLNLTGSPTTADVIQAGMAREFKFMVNFKTPIKVHFNATNGGTVADIIDHSFHIVCAADNIAYAPTIQYYARVSYKE